MIQSLSMARDNFSIRFSPLRHWTRSYYLERDIDGQPMKKSGQVGKKGEVDLGGR